jgi:hypothetical protein
MSIRKRFLAFCPPALLLLFSCPLSQDHLGIPNPVGLGKGTGPDIGHWVSRDFLHWAHLEVAIWNDKWYDNVAIFTGSTTIVDGKPVIICTFVFSCDQVLSEC